MSKGSTKYEDQMHALHSIMSDDLVSFVKKNQNDPEEVRQRLQDDHILVDGQIHDKFEKILDLRLAGADKIAEAERMENILDNAIKITSGTDAERNSVMNLEQGNVISVMMENTFKQWGFSFKDDEAGKFSDQEISSQLEEYDESLSRESGILNKHHRVYTAKHGELSINDVIGDVNESVGQRNDSSPSAESYEAPADAVAVTTPESAPSDSASDMAAFNQERLDDVMDLNKAKVALVAMVAKFEQGDNYSDVEFEELAGNYLLELHNANLDDADLSRLFKLPDDIEEMTVDKMEVLRNLVEPLDNAINSKIADITSDDVAEEARNFTDGHDELFGHDKIIERADQIIEQHHKMDNISITSENQTPILGLTS